MPAERRRGRPRKPEHEKLQPVTTSVPPDVYAILQRVADRHRLSVTELVRRLLTSKATNFVSK